MRAGNQRRLRVTAQPNVTLTLADVPPRCRRARTVLLGPLTPTDLDAASFINAPQGACTPASSGCMRSCACLGWDLTMTHFASIQDALSLLLWMASFMPGWGRFPGHHQHPEGRLRCCRGVSAVLVTTGLWDRAVGFRQAVGLMAQGQQRGLDSAGRVVPFKEPSAPLLVRAGPCSLFLIATRGAFTPPQLGVSNRPVGAVTR